MADWSDCRKRGRWSSFLEADDSGVQRRVICDLSLWNSILLSTSDPLSQQSSCDLADACQLCTDDFAGGYFLNGFRSFSGEKTLDAHEKNHLQKGGLEPKKHGIPIKEYRAFFINSDFKNYRLIVNSCFPRIKVSPLCSCVFSKMRSPLR